MASNPNGTIQNNIIYQTPPVHRTYNQTPLIAQQFQFHIKDINEEKKTKLQKGKLEKVIIINRELYLQKHVEYLDGLEPWPSLMICLLTFSSRTSTWVSTLGGTLPSWEEGSPCTKALPSVTISFSRSEKPNDEVRKNILVNYQFLTKKKKK